MKKILETRKSRWKCEYVGWRNVCQSSYDIIMYIEMIYVELHRLLHQKCKSFSQSKARSKTV